MIKIIAASLVSGRSQSHRGIASLWVLVIMASFATTCCDSLLAQSVAPSLGFEAEDRFVYAARFEGGLSGLAFSPEGEPIVYENGEIRLHRDTTVEVLTSFDPAPFGSFLVLAPDGASVYFGESSEGNIYRVALDGGGRELVDNIAFNYGLAFDSEGRGFLSAGPVTQIIALLDHDPKATNPEIVVDMPGFSGPLVIDDDDNLIYGTADLSKNPIRQSLHLFTKAQLDDAIAGTPISFDAGEMVLSEFAGFNQMVYDDGVIYATELGFGSGAGRVYAIHANDGYSFEDFAVFTIDGGILSPGYMAFHPGSRDFAMGSGSKGGRMLVGYGDFATVSRVTELVPELHFVRGEINGDDRVDLSDAIYLLAFQFLGGEPPVDIESADVNSDANVDVGDPVYLLNFLFRGGPQPSAPYPAKGAAPKSDPEILAKRAPGVQ